MSDQRPYKEITKMIERIKKKTSSPPISSSDVALVTPINTTIRIGAKIIEARELRVSSLDITK